MYTYIVEVLGETTQTPIHRYTIHSMHELPNRLLKVAGLLLDGGMSDAEVSQQLVTAEAYVKVRKPPTR